LATNCRRLIDLVKIFQLDEWTKPNYKVFFQYVRLQKLPSVIKSNDNLISQTHCVIIRDDVRVLCFELGTKNLRFLKLISSKFGEQLISRS